MALTAAQILRVRSMINDKAAATFTDQDILDNAEAMAKVKDEELRAPTHAEYVPTYDLYLLAAELWRLKAGFVSEEFDFRAEGGDFARSQKYRNCIDQAKRYSDMAGQRSANTGIRQP